MLKVEKLTEELSEDVAGEVTACDVGRGIKMGALGLLGAAAVTEMVGLGYLLAGRIKGINTFEAYDKDDCKEKFDKSLKKAVKLRKFRIDIITFGISKKYTYKTIFLMKQINILILIINIISGL